MQIRGQCDDDAVQPRVANHILIISKDRDLADVRCGFGARIGVHQLRQILESRGIGLGNRGEFNAGQVQAGSGMGFAHAETNDANANRHECWIIWVVRSGYRSNGSHLSSGKSSLQADLYRQSRRDLEKSVPIPIDTALAVASDVGLVNALTQTVVALRDRFAQGRGVLHILPVVRPFQTTPIAHLHAGIEVFLQIAGAGEMEGVGGRHRFAAGSVLVVPRGVAHAEHPDSQAGPFWNFVLQFKGDQIGFHLSAGTVVQGGRIRRRSSFTTVESVRIAGYLHEALAAAGSGRTPEHPLVQALVQAHLALFADALGRGTPSHGSVADPLVGHAQVLLAQYLSDVRLSVSWLAGRLGCSADHLSRSFHGRTGVPLVRAITHERVALARQLLADRSLNIAEVARACGFADPAYFSRVFATATGDSPRAWRRLHPN